MSQLVAAALDFPVHDLYSCLFDFRFREPFVFMERKINPASIPSAEDLIEARKPTSLLIAQFFLFPLIIIAICVGIFLLFGYATYQQKTPREYLNEIRSGKDPRGWQTAFELSNVITNQKDKIRDTDFVKDVTAEYQA